MALIWVLRDRRVASTLVGASSVAQLAENLAALDQPNFTEEELAKIDRYAVDSGIDLWRSSLISETSSCFFGANRRLYLVLHRFDALEVSPHRFQIIVRHLRVVVPRHRREDRAAVGSLPGTHRLDERRLVVLLDDSRLRIGRQVRAVADSPRTMKRG